MLRILIVIALVSQQFASRGLAFQIRTTRPETTFAGARGRSGTEELVRRSELGALHGALRTSITGTLSPQEAARFEASRRRLEEARRRGEETAEFRDAIREYVDFAHRILSNAEVLTPALTENRVTALRFATDGPAAQLAQFLRQQQEAGRISAFSPSDLARATELNILRPLAEANPQLAGLVRDAATQLLPSPNSTNAGDISRHEANMAALLTSLADLAGDINNAANGRPIQYTGPDGRRMVHDGFSANPATGRVSGQRAREALVAAQEGALALGLPPEAMRDQVMALMEYLRIPSAQLRDAALRGLQRIHRISQDRMTADLNAIKADRELPTFDLSASGINLNELGLQRLDAADRAALKEVLRDIDLANKPAYQVLLEVKQALERIQSRGEHPNARIDVILERLRARATADVIEFAYKMERQGIFSARERRSFLCGERRGQNGATQDQAPCFPGLHTGVLARREGAACLTNLQYFRSLVGRGGTQAAQAAMPALPHTVPTTPRVIRPQ